MTPWENGGIIIVAVIVTSDRYIYMYICIYVYMYICIYVYMYICMVVDRIMEMEKRFGMGQQTTAARRGRIFP